MGFGDFDFNLRECGRDFFCQNRHDGVLGVKMARVDQVEPQILGIPELVVLDVGRDEGIASGGQSIHHLAGTASAAHGNLLHRIAGVDVAQALTAQLLLDRSQERGKVLRLRFAHPQQTVLQSDGVLKAQLFSQNIVD